MKPPIRASGVERDGIRVAAGSRDGARRRHRPRHRDVQEHDYDELVDIRWVHAGRGGACRQHHMGREPGSVAGIRGAGCNGDIHVLYRGTGDCRNLQFPMADEYAPGRALRQRVACDERAVVAAGPANYEGLWWNSPAGSESGWGINLAHQDDTIFATWFTYDVAGKAWWLSMTASPTLTGTYTGTLFKDTGPPFNSVPFDPTQVHGTAVGTGTLSFTDPNTGIFTYTVNGITQSKPITRQVFGQPPTCTFGIQSDLTLAYNYQDLWWAAPAGSESGWGVNLTHQGDTIFATWFTYDLDRTPLWLSVTAPKTAAGIYSRNSLSNDRAGIQRGAVLPGQSDGHRSRYCDVHFHRRQYRDVRLHGKRRDAEQGDHAPGFRRRPEPFASSLSFSMLPLLSGS